MRKLFSTRYNAGAYNTALLVLRLGVGILMAHHGYEKFSNFHQTEGFMMNFMGIGKSATTALVIFAELFCSVLLILGLFTRLASIPLIILSCVILFQVSHADYFGKGEIITLFLTSYVALLLTGAGKISVDHMISK